MIDPDDEISIQRQCELLGIPRYSYYYKPIPESQENLQLMQEIDKQYLETPFYGSRLMVAHLRKIGLTVNRKRISRLMRRMGLEAIYPKPKRTLWQKRYGKFPYLLKELEVTAQNQVWGADITYIPVNSGYLYLVAIIDLFSRYIVSWELSNSLESRFCIEALGKAFMHGLPKILNSDQGVQFTSCDYIEFVRGKGIEISMSGKGRCWDNILMERFWRSLKYEEVYSNEYCGSKDAYEGISSYIDLYNYKRPHSALNYQTPATVYRMGG